MQNVARKSGVGTGLAAVPTMSPPARLGDGMVPAAGEAAVQKKPSALAE